MQAVDEAHEQVFGEVPGRDVTRWFSDASALTRYGIPTLNYGTSTGLMDVELGENLDIDGLVEDGRDVRARREEGLRMMKLVTYDDGKVGRIEGDEIVRLDVPTMREYFERGGADDTDGARSARRRRSCARRSSRRSSSTPRATSASTRRSRRTSTGRTQIAPWINFFQNVDAIVGPDEPVIYPEHLTEELDYELELAVILKKAGKWFSPEEAEDYIGGYVIFNDITARDIQRGEMRSGVFSFCKAIDTFCPLGPWIVTPDEIPDPHDLRWSCA